MLFDTVRLSSAAARHRQRVGRLGERVAALVLSRAGGAIRGQNVRVGRGEIDLVVEFAGERVAVEVKTLTASKRQEDPMDHFDAVKRARVRSAALSLEPAAYRVDLVTVVLRSDRVDVRWLPRVA